MKNNSKKYSIIGIVIVLLLLVGVFALSGNNEGGNFVPAGECPEGEIMNMEKGVCEPIDKIPDEVGPIGETETGEPTKTDFKKILFAYKESDENWSSVLHKELAEELDGHQAYYRILSFTQGKEMSFAVGYMKGCPDGCYLDSEEPCPKECLDPNNWKEIKRFVPAEHIQELGGGETRNEGTFSGGKYHGQFVKLNDPSYRSAVTGCAIDPTPLRLDYCNPCGNLEKNEAYRIWPSEQIAIVLP